jgi:hypothetical protein
LLDRRARNTPRQLVGCQFFENLDSKRRNLSSVKSAKTSYLSLPKLKRNGITKWTEGLSVKLKVSGNH